MGNSVKGIFNTYLNKLGLSWPNLAMPKPDFSDHSVFWPSPLSMDLWSRPLVAKQL